MNDCEFKLFVPPKYPKKPFDFQKFNVSIGKSFVYCSRGRHAIYHALKSLGITGKVVIPCYVCTTIRNSVLAAGLECYVCDVDPEDLNISFDAFKKLYETSDGIECVIVPSLYGNPADILSFEKYCKEKKIKLIDDAAQSFGASIGDRYLSSFGDAGVIAFSPGKATPAPMGALLWSKNKLEWKKKKHPTVHRAIYKNYYVNRLGAYKNYPGIYRKLVSKISFFAERIFDIKYDTFTSKEIYTIGGVVDATFTGKFDFRKKYHDKFCEKFHKTDLFRIIRHMRGTPVYPKIVIVAKDENTKNELEFFLKSVNIAIYTGYPIVNNGVHTVNANKYCKCVIELPIEDDDEKMEYLFSCINEFIDSKENER